MTPRALTYAMLALGMMTIVAPPLLQQGIDVTAIHHHGLLDMPRLFYMHFWATDDPVKPAQGLKAALDHTNSAKP